MQFFQRDRSSLILQYAQMKNWKTWGTTNFSVHRRAGSSQKTTVDIYTQHSPILFSLNSKEGLGLFNCFLPHSFTLSLPPASCSVCKWLRVKQAFKNSKQNGFCPLGLRFELGNTHHVIKQTLSIRMVGKQGSG